MKEYILDKIQEPINEQIKKIVESMCKENKINYNKSLIFIFLFQSITKIKK